LAHPPQQLRPPHLSENEEVRERFEREARAISSLNHPHICTLFDVGRDGAAEYFVMELLEGESVAARLERGPMKLDETLKTGAQIAEALAAAHKQGIVHRDLKPGNVVLTKSGAKVLDFGVAKLRDESVVDNRTRTTPLTSMGTMLGTVQYMSPEQLEGHPVDHRADLFAFGALLYEMLTGQRAFAGTSQASVIAAILDKDPRPISEVLPTSPPALDRMVKLCLAKDPDERWQSAGDLARELKWIAGGTGSGPVTTPVPTAARRGATRSITPWIVARLADSPPGRGSSSVPASDGQVPRPWSLSRLTRWSTTCAAIRRYVVSLPPATVTIPPGPSAMMCSRDTELAPTAPSSMSGRSPAQVAMTSSSPRCALGNRLLADRSRYRMSSDDVRTSSGDSAVSVSVVPI